MLQHHGYARCTPKEGAAHVVTMTYTQKTFTATADHLREHDGLVTVLRPLDTTNDRYDPEVGPMFVVRTATGLEFDAFGDELTEPVSPHFAETFEKFLAHARSDWPDIDGNLEPTRRER